MLVSRFDHRPDSVADRVQTGFRHVDRAAVEASFKKAAFGAGDASADPAERWNQIRRGLSAIRGGETREAVAPAVAKAETFAAGETKAVDHLAQVRQAMRAGLVEKVEIGTVKARGGETLADLAAKHLGDPRKARILASFNRLPLEGALTEGSTVRIPTGGIIDRLRMHELPTASPRTPEAPRLATVPASKV